MTSVLRPVLLVLLVSFLLAWRMPAGDEPVVRNLFGFTVHVDPALVGDPEGERALSMLGNHLERLTVLLPAERLKEMRQLEIAMDKQHPLGGMQYHPSARWLKANGYDVRYAKKVHIPTASALLSRSQMLKHPAVVLHELAHAYHDQILGFDHEPIRAAFAQAVRGKSYEDVMAHTGRTVRHYALTDEKEYFAEATEAYLYRNDFFPFVRAELKEFDPRIHELCAELWGDPE